MKKLIKVIFVLITFCVSSNAVAQNNQAPVDYMVGTYNTLVKNPGIHSLTIVKIASKPKYNVWLITETSPTKLKPSVKQAQSFGPNWPHVLPIGFSFVGDSARLAELNPLMLFTPSVSSESVDSHNTKIELYPTITVVDFDDLFIYDKILIYDIVLKMLTVGQPSSK